MLPARRRREEGEDGGGGGEVTGVQAARGVQEES